MQIDWRRHLRNIISELNEIGSVFEMIPWLVKIGNQSINVGSSNENWRRPGQMVTKPAVQSQGSNWENSRLVKSQPEHLSERAKKTQSLLTWRVILSTEKVICAWGRSPTDSEWWGSGLFPSPVPKHLSATSPKTGMFTIILGPRRRFLEGRHTYMDCAFK